jgi:hypothetical protein
MLPHSGNEAGMVACFAMFRRRFRHLYIRITFLQEKKIRQLPKLIPTSSNVLHLILNPIPPNGVESHSLTNIALMTTTSRICLLVPRGLHPS